MQLKITVIVPVYNTERFLSKCIDSVLAQTHSNLELLLIDDGSSDCSPQICDEYALRDERVRVFHQMNAGVSVARNLGIENATGDYIIFVDSDDYLDEDYLSCFNPEHADLYLQGVTLENEQGVTNQTLEPKELHDRKKVADFVAQTLPLPDEGLVLRAVCSKLYRRDILASLRFDEGMSFAEDYLLNLRVYQHIRCMTLVSGCGYHYVQQNSSLSVGKYPLEKFLRWHRIQQDEVLELARNWEKPQMFEKVVEKRFSHLYRILLSSRSYTLNEKYQAYSYMHKYLNLPECKGISHEDIILMLMRLPFTKFSFYIIMGRILLARMRLQLFGSNN